MIKTGSKKGLVAMVAVLAAVGLALAGCSGSTPSTKTLTLANSAGMQSFDTTEADDGLLIQYYQPVFDSLLRKDPAGEIVPFLATEYTYNDDFTELTLNLRTDVKFTDGEVFNADAAVANLQHQIEGKGPNAGRVMSIDSVTADGDSTVVIKLKTPDPGLLDSLATGVGMMASPKSLTAADVKTNPVGSGPYTLDTKETVAGDTYVYVANPNYWSKDLQKFSSITIKTMTDMVPRLNALKSGQVQGAPLDIGQYTEAKSVSGLTLQQKMDDWGGIQLIDRTGAVVPALGELKVRQAINYAIDQEGLISAFRTPETAEPTYQLFAEGTPAYVKELDTAYKYDVAKAKQLMSEAGYADGFEVTVPDMSGNFGADLYATVIEQLAEIGIKVNLETGLAFPDMIGKIMGGSYGMLISGGPIGTDWYQASNYYGPGFFNPLHTADDTTTSLLQTIATTTGDEQKKAYQELNTYVVENAWMAPYFRDATLYGNTADITVTTQFANIVPYIWSYSPAS